MTPQWTIIIVGATWIFTVLVTSLPAPTKDSSTKYVYWFKVLNALAGAIHRAESTTLEHSPNFQNAMQVYFDRLAQSQNQSQQQDQGR